MFSNITTRAASRIPALFIGTRAVIYGLKPIYRSYNIESGEKPSILLGSGNFKELVLGSTILTDKSWLIKDLEEHNNKVSLFTFPRRWGKTTNLTMLKEFYQLVTDPQGEILPKGESESYKLFAGGEIVLNPIIDIEPKLLPALKISSDENMMRKQGITPVIYLDLKDVPGSSYENALVGLKKSVYKSFSEHKYLLSSINLDREEKQLFEEFTGAKTYKTIDQISLKESLIMLTQLLYQHHGRKVMILIDEYDSAINKAYINHRVSADDTADIVELYRDFLSPALKGNDYLDKAIMTGIFKLAKANIFSGLNNVVAYGMNDIEYSKYYGFTQEEVSELCDVYNVDSKIQEAIKDWYNGYNSGGLEIYNPWSVVNILSKYQAVRHITNKPEEEILKNYWGESGNINFITPLLKHPNIKNKVEKLISGEAISFELKSELSVEDYDNLKQILYLGSNSRVTEEAADVLFSYLTFGGYLTKMKDSNLYITPNREVRDVLRSKLLTYYKSKYNIDSTLFDKATDQLQLLLEAKSSDDYDKVKHNLQLALNKIFKAAPSFNKVNKDAVEVKDGEEYWHGNEDLLHSILSYTILQLKGVNQFATEVYIGDGRADLLYLSKEFQKAVILELKYNQHEALSAIEQIHDKHYDRPIPKGFNVINIGVNIDSDKKLDLAMEIIEAPTDQLAEINLVEEITNIDVNTDVVNLISNDDISQNEQTDQIIIGEVTDSDLT